MFVCFFSVFWFSVANISYFVFVFISKMSEVGLTETVHNGKGSDARKFELWLQGIDFLLLFLILCFVSFSRFGKKIGFVSSLVIDPRALHAAVWIFHII